MAFRVFIYIYKFMQDSPYYFWCLPTIYLLASHINFQFKRYVSYKPDPGAHAIDAFYITWRAECFLEFSLWPACGSEEDRSRQDNDRCYYSVLAHPNFLFYDHKDDRRTCVAASILDPPAHT